MNPAIIAMLAKRNDPAAEAPLAPSRREIDNPANLRSQIFSLAPAAPEKPDTPPRKAIKKTVIPAEYKEKEPRSLKKSSPEPVETDKPLKTAPTTSEAPKEKAVSIAEKENSPHLSMSELPQETPVENPESAEAPAPSPTIVNLYAEPIKETTDTPALSAEYVAEAVTGKNLLQNIPAVTAETLPEFTIETAPENLAEIATESAMILEKNAVENEILAEDETEEITGSPEAVQTPAIPLVNPFAFTPVPLTVGEIETADFTVASAEQMNAQTDLATLTIPAEIFASEEQNADFDAALAAALPEDMPTATAPSAVEKQASAPSNEKKAFDPKADIQPAEITITPVQTAKIADIPVEKLIFDAIKQQKELTAGIETVTEEAAAAAPGTVNDFSLDPISGGMITGVTGAAGELRAVKESEATVSDNQKENLAKIPLSDGVTLELSRSAEDGSLTVNLDPIGEGTLDLIIETAENGAVTATLRAEKPETLNAIRKEAAQLEKALTDAGINLGGGGLDFRQGGRDDQKQGENFYASNNNARSGNVNGGATLPPAFRAENLYKNLEIAADGGGLDIKV